MPTVSALRTAAALNRLAGSVAGLTPNRNGAYGGRDLSALMTAQALQAAVVAGDFGKIRVGDYWPVTLSGSYRDYAACTCPAGTAYYSDTALTAPAGTIAQACEAACGGADYYCTVVIGDGTYYAATDACLAYFERSLAGAVFKLEVAAINPYRNYAGFPDDNHLVLCSRDLIPHPLKMRIANTEWVDPAAVSPWPGSALYRTLNDEAHGMLPLLAATPLGAYLYAGPAGRGMIYYAETKGPGASSATSIGPAYRGRLFLPGEREVFGGDTWSEHQWGAGLAVQWPIFRDSVCHITKGLGDGGTNYYWWLQSSRGGYPTYFAAAASNGSPGYMSAANEYGGAPLCFLLA